MKQHKWHKEIKAWADGAEIECMVHGSSWMPCLTVEWDNDLVYYRIKPQPKEPQYLYVFCDNKGEQILRTHTGQNSHETYVGKIKLEVDDEKL